MPQLDISTFSSQIFWFLIFFSSLFFIVSCLFLTKLDEIISTRSKEVLDSFNSSIHLLRLTEEQIAKYNAALNQARVRAKKIIDDAFAQVEEMRANVKDILKEEDKKVIKLVEEKVVQFKSKYISELKQMATSIALIYYTKLANSEIEEEFVADLVSKEF
ncbi:ATP synthase subunit b [Wolbachia endosymbiont of Drosophila simulans wNo]|uniref:F0F1 ATP synthase subunit B family protein n=1 Tax=Wolbachia endosymbiont of Drosophila simulans TaxID=77038 RepID=UPI0002D254C1|nr:ATP synthase subunit B [Wolbachia endosymbiont of Drosophila simulans]AGJ98752.1 ATP synthase subunit b [Wolbachia endosymbiont of Drosophila simulans wNo]